MQVLLKGQCHFALCDYLGLCGGLSILPVFIWKVVGSCRFVVGRGRDMVIRAGKLEGRVSPCVGQA